jgi:peptidyl-prolyl cis-trans isomerase C
MAISAPRGQEPNHVHPFLAVLALCTLLLPACSRAGDPAPPLVARGDGVAIPTAELQAAIDGMPPAARARHASLEARRELLDSLVVLELLAGEARRAGLGDGPDFREGGKRKMVQRLVQNRFHDPDGPRTVPEAEVRAYYEANLDRYVQPVKMSLAHITLEAPEGSPRRGARLAEARRLRDRLARDGARDPEAFAAAVASIVKAGDPETQAADLGLLSEEQITRAFTPDVAKAAWALPPGQPSPVLSSPRGFHILQGNGGQPALQATLDQARGGIQVVLYQARMAEAYGRRVRELRDAAQVQVDEEQLARIRVVPEGAAGAAAPGR